MSTPGDGQETYKSSVVSHLMVDTANDVEAASATYTLVPSGLNACLLWTIWVVPKLHS